VIESDVGCFGSILVFDRAQICPQCPLFDRCAVQVQTNRERLAVELKRMPQATTVQKAVVKRAASRKNQMKTLLAPPSPPPTTFTPAPAAANLNKKPRERLESWLKKFVDLSLLRRGINPLSVGFHSKNDRIYMDIILAMPVWTRVQFIDEWHARRAAEGEERWKDGTMSAQFLINTDILIAQGYLQRDGDNYKFLEAP
jgi:hypothetical protein